MKMIKLNILILFIVMQTGLLFRNVLSCSVVKITCNGKTVVGNNEDFWDPDTRIWFEPGDNSSYGSMYVGYSYLLPEGGMNEKGLMFDGLAVNYKVVNDTLGKKHIDENDLKKKIMRECSTVEEVKKLISKYNISFWSKVVWLFVEKSGEYLLVDGDTHILGDNAYCVQTNFHPSTIFDKNNIDCWRYKKVMSLLDKHYESNINFCTSIMDSIHWSGTRYTTVYDLNNAEVYLYFSHDYTKSVKFNLKDELRHGRNILIIPELFKENKDAYNYYVTNLKIKELLTGLDNEINIQDPFKILHIKNEVKNLGFPFLAEKYINNLGYDWMMNRKNCNNAIILFKLNVELFPQSPDVYDSLGEAFMENKQYKQALNNYLRSVELDPGNANGKQRIASLLKLIEQ